MKDENIYLQREESQRTPLHRRTRAYPTWAKKEERSARRGVTLMTQIWVDIGRLTATVVSVTRVKHHGLPPRHSLLSRSRLS